MTFKTTLFHALEIADKTWIAPKEQIEGNPTVSREPFYRLGTDWAIVTLGDEILNFSDQEIEVCDDGLAILKSQEGEEYRVGLLRTVTVPLEEDDL